jgi:uncharacterized protein (TIGR02677 family)
MTDSLDEQADRARRLFRYVTGDEWREYRAIMSVFAGTFFAELTPDDVIGALRTAGAEVDPAVVPDRLESLRTWGNLAVSSSVGNPTNLADYYRRRNRYLITRAGQEVHDLVEGVLQRVDEVRDVSTGRLRSLHEALLELGRTDLARTDAATLTDRVRAVFDPHIAFTDEITQFFASINQWQSRYDLSPDEFRFFAEVLVGYVGERLAEIERLARPISVALGEVLPRADDIVARLEHGLAGRVDRAGLAGGPSVRRAAGTTVADWDHLAAWFQSRQHRPSRISALGRDAVAAIRTLTLNLTRLSRQGLGAASRRADLLRLASILHTADPADVPRLVTAAFGMHSAVHVGVPAADANDPEPTSTSWWDAPRAHVPIALRERGDTTNRGRPSPIADRSAAQRLLAHRREAERRAAARVDAELVAAGSFDDAVVSESAFARLQQLIARSSHGATPQRDERSIDDAGLRLVVRRAPGAVSSITTPAGTLRLIDIRVAISAVSDDGGRDG